MPTPLLPTLAQHCDAQSSGGELLLRLRVWHLRVEEVSFILHCNFSVNSLHKFQHWCGAKSHAQIVTNFVESLKLTVELYEGFKITNGHCKHVHFCIILHSTVACTESLCHCTHHSLTICFFVSAHQFSISALLRYMFEIWTENTPSCFAVIIPVGPQRDSLKFRCPARNTFAGTKNGMTSVMRPK